MTDNRKMKRCSCGAVMPADKIEFNPNDREKIILTSYICSCMVQKMVHLKNIGPEKASAFLFKGDKYERSIN